MTADKTCSYSGRRFLAICLLLATGAGSLGYAAGHHLPSGSADGAAAFLAAGAGLALAGVALALAFRTHTADAAPRAAAETPFRRAPEPTRSVAVEIAVPVAGPVIDEAALESLLRLGGENFVDEVVAQFVSESVLLLLRVAQAVGEKDAAEYAAQVHALRSSAANVGARRLYALCLAWREVAAEELALSGSARFVAMQKEFQAAEQMLKAWRSGRAQGMTAAALAG